MDISMELAKISTQMKAANRQLSDLPVLMNRVTGMQAQYDERFKNIAEDVERLFEKCRIIESDMQKGMLTIEGLKNSVEASAHQSETLVDSVVKRVKALEDDKTAAGVKRWDLWKLIIVVVLGMSSSAFIAWLTVKMG